MIIAEYTIPGVHIRDHVVRVPLDWTRPDSADSIELFVREVVDPTRRDEELPRLAFLQGGPGGKSPRPANGGPAWLAEALKTHRIILMDQRGTGRSSPVQGRTIEAMPPEAAAAFLACFRADSIVADLEHLRKTVYGGMRWETLGQSYGGFLTLAYLSQAPEGLSACYVTGGLAGLQASAEDVYRRTYPRVAAKNARYYARYPSDGPAIAEIADFIAGNDVALPDGDRLSVRRLQTIGIDFGMAPGFENVHWLIDEAFSDRSKTRLSDHFLAAMMQATSYDGNPLFAVLQESIYGQSAAPTAWSAERVRAEHPCFADDRRPLLLTGEMMFPWMFEEIRSLRPFRVAAEALADYRGFGPLYDLDRLARNDVPVAAVIYHDDMYVDAALSLQTAGHVGNTQSWVTNEFEHDGVRQSPGVFRRLVAMVREQGGPLRR